MNKLPENIDHLIYTTSDLQVGMDEIEKLLGVKPVIGGRHPKYGTRNALLSLGASTYLEIVAPDLGQSPPERGRLLQESFNQNSKLTTWVLRSEQIEEMHSKAIQNGLTLGNVASGKREKSDGTVVSWWLTNPYAFPFNGAIPFLISWGKTPHPAKTIPKAGELVSLEIKHPNPEQIRKYLKILGVNIKITKADNLKLNAKIKTENGMVTLE